MKKYYGDEEVLLEVGDGPEGLTIYTSEDGGVVDWSTTTPTVYVVFSNNEVSFRARLTMPSVVKQLVEALAPRSK